MKERPIIMSAPMVRAQREGRKSQTRRRNGLETVNIEPDAWTFSRVMTQEVGERALAVFTRGGRIITIACPYGLPGDQLWVKEAFTFINADRERYELCIAYNADGETLPNRPSIRVTPSQYADFMGDERDKVDPFHRRKYPAMFMNRFFSRSQLEIIAIRVERVQDISETDAIAEGISVSVVDPSPRGVAPIYPKQYGYAKDVFRDLWTSINGPGSWESNPWVWALTFKEVR